MTPTNPAGEAPHFPSQPPIQPSYAKTSHHPVSSKLAKNLFSAGTHRRQSSSKYCSQKKKIVHLGKKIIYFGKIGWVAAWTAARISAIAIFTLPIVIPAMIASKAYRFFTSLRKTNKLAVKSRETTPTPPAKPKKQRPSHSPRLSAQEKQQQGMTPEALILHQLKNQAPRSKTKRNQYFNYYNQCVEKLFTAKNGNNPGIPKEYVTLSRESYLNLTLVYKFDGLNMKGCRFTFIDDSLGEETAVTYKVDRVFLDPQGLVGYGFVPINNDKAPLRLIFRGTNNSTYTDDDDTPKKLPSGYSADFSAAIGKKAYENCKDSIRQWLTQNTQQRRAAFVSGHSLGGNLAQRVLVDNPDLVGQLWTLNSPRLENNSNCLVPSHIKINHVLMMGDWIIPKAGGGRWFSAGKLATTNGEEEVTLVLDRKKSHRESHVAKTLNDICMKRTTPPIALTSTEALIKRDAFWAGILNFIRPHFGS